MKVCFAILLLITGPALAAGAARPAEGSVTENHFPQSVQVGALIGRKLIGPKESQPLLGHVEAVERGGDGAVILRIRTWSLLPWSGHSVAVPLEAVSFLGPQLALTGLTEAQLEALPAPAGSTPIPAGETIRVDLVKPFH